MDQLYEYGNGRDITKGEFLAFVILISLTLLCVIVSLAVCISLGASNRTRGLPINPATHLQEPENSSLAKALHLRDSVSRKLPAAPYQSRVRLLSISEQRFFESLEKSIPRELMICPKVRMLDILGCPEGIRNYASLSRISSKHIDFVLVERVSSKIVHAIELDESYLGERARDQFVNYAFQTAKIPLMRVDTSAQYNLDELRQKLCSYAA